ncbi:hypothetical protein [Lentilitoribacter sp. EG35]|uniref:hypothetical protein n=1 Tax=Lentilitoribacter sp. EG35 TaxID=3234192 RepID=UPI00345F9411
MNSFERDIEDAIFETIEMGERAPGTPSAGNQPRAVHISKIREQLISNQNDPSQNNPGQRLSVFSKIHDKKVGKPVLSQIILTLAICSIITALLFPMLWFVSSQVDNLTSTIDNTVLTGSIGSEGVFSKTKKLTENPIESGIFDKPKPNKAANEGHVVRIDRGLSAGSIIYVNPN